MRFSLRLSCFIISIIFLNNVYSQLSGNVNVGFGQTYTSLSSNGGLFQAINNQGLSGNLTVYITSNTNENGNNSLNQWAGNYTLVILPSSPVVKALSGADNTALIDLDGADNVTIDGRFNGSGRYLRFVNTNTGGSTFRFINDATNNTLTYCTIEGANAVSNSGVILFGTTTGTTGNDNNTISFCDVRDISTIAGATPINAISSNGSSASSNVYNSNNSLLNNNIFNFYFNGANCSGVLLYAGSASWIISGNSFYQTTARTNANATGWNVIWIYAATADNISISNNYIGGTSANCGGTPWTVAGNVSNYFYAIRSSYSSTTVASNIDGNTIANFNFSSNPASAATSYFSCILIERGYYNIGTSSGNTIGNITTNGNITLTYSGSTTNVITRGIDHRGIGDINNNTIGSIDIGGSSSGINRLEVINYSGTPTQPISISNNYIGSSTVSGSIQTTSNIILQLTGIYSALNDVNVSINNNSIMNLTNNSVNIDARVRGIYQNRGTTGKMTINNNFLSEISGAGLSTDKNPENCSLIGIFSGSNDANQVVNGNTIKGLRGFGTANSYVQGFSFYNNAGKGTFNQNKIFDLTNYSTGASPKIYAVNAYWGQWSFCNNQVCLTNGETTLDNRIFTSTYSNTVLNNESTNSDAGSTAEYLVKDATNKYIPCAEKTRESIGDFSTISAEIKGFNEESEFGGTYYYNSVYIGGRSNAGSSNTFAFDRPLTAKPSPVLLRNNILINVRNGSGNHFAIGNEISPPTMNWPATTSNYNVFITANANTVGNWGTNTHTINQWRNSSGGDRLTWATNRGNLNPMNLFNDLTNGDLSINTSKFEAWIVSGKGIAISGQGADFEGEPRPTSISGGCSDIGADELSSTPPNCPSALFDNAPGPGVISTYTLWNRVIAVITWGAGGVSYPTALDVKCYSGVNHPNALIGNFSNTYWSFTPTGSLSGAAYDIAIYFGDNETYTINNPSSDIRLAKYNTSWEVFSNLGTGVYETELNWPNLWTKTRGPSTFSDYILTDVNSPLPVELCSFSGSVVNNRVASLNWVTCLEMNNMGFDIERRDFNLVSNQYDLWKKVGFKEGRGTTSEQTSYSFKDSKLEVGKYQYRLKQLDYNGNHEYFDLNTPSEIIIGKPATADLFQNYPNPSNPNTKVDFQIPYSAKVSLKVYDITGSEIAILVNNQLEPGYYTSEFNGLNLASGIYFYRLIAESGNGQKFAKTMKLVLVK